MQALKFFFQPRLSLTAAPTDNKLKKQKPAAVFIDLYVFIHLQKLAWEHKKQKETAGIRK